MTYWGQALEAGSHWRSDGNAARFGQSSSGGLMGIEAQAPDGSFRLGMVGGHNRDRMRGQGQADVDSYNAGLYGGGTLGRVALRGDRKSTRLNSQSLMRISYAVFCLKKKTITQYAISTQINIQ